MKYIYPIILFLLCSCNKKILNKNDNYSGEWGGYGNSCNYLFDIDLKSHLLYRASCLSGTDDRIEGTARLGKDKIHIGLYSFKIISPPTKIDYSPGQDTIYFYSFSSAQLKIANWQMRLIPPKYHGGHEIQFYKE